MKGAFASEFQSELRDRYEAYAEVNVPKLQQASVRRFQAFCKACTPWCGVGNPSSFGGSAQAGDAPNGKHRIRTTKASCPEKTGPEAIACNFFPDLGAKPSGAQCPPANG